MRIPFSYINLCFHPDVLKLKIKKHSNYSFFFSSSPSYILPIFSPFLRLFLSFILPSFSSFHLLFLFSESHLPLYPSPFLSFLLLYFLLFLSFPLNPFRSAISSSLNKYLNRIILIFKKIEYSLNLQISQQFLALK